MTPHTRNLVVKGTNVLIVDDEPEIRSEIRDYLSRFEVSVLEAGYPSEAFHILSKDSIDIMILDIKLPEMSGIEMLREMRKCCPSTAVIMVSGHGEIDDVIEALRMGASDYFRKPFKVEDLLQSIIKIIDQVSFNRALKKDYQNYLFEGPSSGKKVFGNLVAVSERSKKVLEQMRLVARSDDTTVLITGESGTGKELAAKGIHQLSKRKDRVFHSVNCSSIPDELFESEFFGYEKGAFTGANSNKPGWFEIANHGTLFLDEIADMKPSLQAKLLRIMEDGQVTRLGATKTTTVDVRIIAATNKDLEEMVKQGSFRADLYYRLHLFTIDLPTLKERREDIPYLFAQFLEFYAMKLEMKVPKVQKEVMNALMHYDFPGNVRELKHMVERALILCEGSLLSFKHFDHLEMKLKKSISLSGSPLNFTPLNLVEKEVILKTLQQTNFNISKAARILKISRQALSRKMKKNGIELE